MSENPAAAEIVDSFRARAFGPPLGRGQGSDLVTECPKCAALVIHDQMAMLRHAEWHLLHAAPPAQRLP